MNIYELTIILDGKASPAKKKSLVEKIGKLVKLNGGKIIKKEDWGKKDFAYPIKKNNTGIYLFFELELEPDAVKKISEKIRIDEDFLRHLIVKKEK